MRHDDWVPLGPDLDAVLTSNSDPLKSLSEAEVPAILLRSAFDPRKCDALVQRFIDRGLMRDPGDSEAAKEDPRMRIDIGTSLGNKGRDQESFFAHSAETHGLFNTLFDGLDNPVKMMYDALQTLAKDKIVKTAEEPDGRQYGPAIFRVHYGGHTYKPHIDHVVLREKRFNYAVSRFSNQFAGVLCMQNAVHEGRSSQSIVHRCLWTPEIQEHIAADTFHEYARNEDISHYRSELEQGDMYFFNTRLIHEVPALQGNDPRVVLATFIGYEPDEPEVFVWS